MNEDYASFLTRDPDALRKTNTRISTSGRRISDATGVSSFHRRSALARLFQPRLHIRPRERLASCAFHPFHWQRRKRPAEHVGRNCQPDEGSAGRGRSGDAQYLLQWIQRHGKTEFAKLEAQQHGKRRFKQANDIDAPLGVLVHHNYIRPRPAAKRGPGRPASPVYEVNPAFGHPATLEKRPENPENPGADTGPANSQNIQSTLASQKTASTMSPKAG